MKYKYIIGLDIGTNSLGWCLLKEYENNEIEIIKTGVHIFPIGTIVDETNSKEKTKNEQRRSYRGASRMRYRFKLRRKNLKQALDKLGMLPDYSEYYKLKGLGQSYELYKLRAEAINPEIKIPLKEIGRIFMLLNKYRGFKSNSKKLAKKDNEAGIVEKDYNKLQNFIDASGSATIGEYFFKMHQKAKQLYIGNKWHNYNEPIDERAYNDNNEIVLFNSNGIRRHHGRYTLRDMYYNEFDKIWAAQKINYPKIFTGSKKEYDEISKLPYKLRIEALKEFKKTNYWHIKEYCIYYQRPLKSQKRFVSNCQFERGYFETKKIKINEDGIEKIKQNKIWIKKAKKATPKSNPLFQEFRIWQKLQQISYSTTKEEFNKGKLKKEWLPTLVEVLMVSYEVHLNPSKKIKNENLPYFGKILQEKGLINNPDNYSFFIDKADEDVISEEKNVEKIGGNVTYASFFEALGREKFNEIKNKTITRKEQTDKGKWFEIVEDKLMMLWNTIYQAKDGLFKEDDWLKCILTDSDKWNLTDEQAKSIIENGLIPDYGSYSSKVLKAILPFMRRGMNEYEALKAAGLGYINEDNTVGKKVQLRNKISQLTYQELRNPVVERALSKTIKLVNALLERYKEEVDRETFEIRIESTRELKKPRQERENERRKNSEKDKIREEYVEHLNKHSSRLGFAKTINKFDSIVNKYELWLQMNMNEEEEMFINEFKSFSKITREEDKLKHKLWLECGRICPYTGDVISFTNCFSSEVEIEHIIPLSRSLDDSFNNKTLTFRKTNAEKGSMTPIEFLEKKGGHYLKDFKNRLKSKNHKFSESKKDLFLAENIVSESNFSNNQISNTSYIATYTRKKMMEVCRNVQFTTGAATAALRNYDWGLNNLLDKIRYEEDFRVNMDDCKDSVGVYTQYKRIKQDCINWSRKKFNSTDFKLDFKNPGLDKNIIVYISETNNDFLYWHDELEKFNAFRNQTGKKDRSDHRHHAIDAFVIAACSPKIIKVLSTVNAKKEQQILPNREKIERNFNYENLKDSIASILVSHQEKQTLIKKRINKIKTKDGIKINTTYAPQGKLHEESYYSKNNGTTVRRVTLFDDNRQTKPLFQHPKDLDYTVKGVVKWSYISDKGLYELTQSRIESFGVKAFTKNEMESNPFYMTSPKSPNIKISKKKGKPLPIVKSIRKRFNIDRTLIELCAKNEQNEILNNNRYAKNESNYMMIYYKNGDKLFARPISFFNAIKNKMQKNSLFPDEIEYKETIFGLDTDLPWVKSGDILFICLPDENINNIDWQNISSIKNRFFKVKGFSSLITPNPKYGNYEYGNTSLLNIKIAHTNSYPPQKNIESALELNAFTLSHDKFNAIKVRIDILGEIIAKGKGCFLNNS